MKRVVHAACPHDCPDACAVLITVDGDRAVKIQGDPKHPVTRGFLCAKVAKYLDRVYSPERVLYPTRRVGPKGLATARVQNCESAKLDPASPIPQFRNSAIPQSSLWQRISWDEALDEIAARLKTIAAEFGPESILPYSYGGTLGVLNN